ncbi:MAG TPA: histidine phosphatase family protein [Firmicutes bacterium]|nr:histidine phosphatase family protein [Bacillota bacterium]
MELWLVRHGTTRANLEHRFQGQLNTVLSPEGRRESEQLARRLMDFSPDWFFSSDLLRAWETAQIISRAIKVKVNPMMLLRECSWGIIEGMTRDEVAERYPYLARKFYYRRPAVIPGAERKRRLMVRARSVLAALDSLAVRPGKVLLVSHGRFINAFISTCLGLRSRDRWPFSPAPASLSILDYLASEQRFKLMLFNDCCHLREGLFAKTAPLG